MNILGVRFTDVEYKQLEIYFNENKKIGESISEFYADFIMRKIMRVKDLGTSPFIKNIIKK